MRFACEFIQVSLLICSVHPSHLLDNHTKFLKDLFSFSWDMKVCLLVKVVFTFAHAVCSHMQAHSVHTHDYY